MNFRPLGDAREHYWKVIKMADAVGVSLVDAWNDGRLTSQDFDGMITRCRGCSAPGACGRLLDQREALDEAPGYCVNKADLDGL